MEIKIIQEDFFVGGAVVADLYREGLKSGKRLSMTLEVNKVKYFVYVPELFNILNSKKIPLLNGQIADGTVFAQEYVTGYNSGIEYFKEEFPETHLMLNADQYFSTLHYCYFHQAPNFTKNNGWIHWVNSYPTSLNPKQIEEYGFCAGINFCIKRLERKNPTLFKTFVKCEHSTLPEQTVAKKEQEVIEIKPALKPEVVQIVFDILKDFFSPEHQTEFRKLIETGNNVNNKLHFKGNGNRLTDSFKKLIEHDFITGCLKQDLINWIISNFTYTQQNKMKVFIYDTVEKTISRNDNPCKSPLIIIKNGQIQKVEHPRTKKYNKY